MKMLARYLASAIAVVSAQDMELGSYGSSSPIKDLVPGSVSGGLITAKHSHHLVVQIRANDAEDGFHVVGSSGVNGVDENTPTEKYMSVQPRGVTTNNLWASAKVKAVTVEADTVDAGTVKASTLVQAKGVDVNTLNVKENTDGTGGTAMTLGSYSSGSDIQSLIAGSVSGGLITAKNSHHLVVQIKANDAEDGFHVVGSSGVNGVDVHTPTEKYMSVQPRGVSVKNLYASSHVQAVTVSDGQFGHELYAIPSFYHLSERPTWTIEFTSGSYFGAEVTLTLSQTNGGPYNNLYLRGIWHNNHHSHSWNVLDSVGSTGSQPTITASDQNFNGASPAPGLGAGGGGTGSSPTNNGMLRIVIPYGGGSFSGGKLSVKKFNGAFSVKTNTGWV